jgi:hypothetical protein
MKEQIAQTNKEALGGFLLFEGQAVMFLNKVGKITFWFPLTMETKKSFP